MHDDGALLMKHYAACVRFRNSARDRLTMTKARRQDLERSGVFHPEHLIPAPVLLAYALKLRDHIVLLTGLAPARSADRS